MRSLRHECFSVGVVFALPVAIAIVFPYKAVGFKAMRDAEHPKAHPTAAFVTLTEQGERAALKVAKTAWQSDGRRKRIRLPLGTLPSEDNRPVLAPLFPRPAIQVADVSYAPPPYLPSLAAPSLGILAPDAADKPAPPFPRSEMLELR